MNLQSEYRDEFMDEAFKQAQEALEAGEVPIGCCFIHDNKIIATGRNEVNLTKEGI